MKKMQISVAIAGLAALAHGATTVEIHSTLDPDTGRMMGDVTALTNAIATYTTSSTIVKLDPGDYDLTGIQMEAEGSEFGKSHLVVSGVQIIGQGESPEDVRLIGDGTCRVYRMIRETYAKLQNLTITNGYAKTIEGAANSKHGGGIYGYPTVTNCVIIGNKADGYGGGAYGYTYIGKCRVLNNSAASGGGAYQPNWVINSLVRGNHSSSQGGGIFGNNYGRAEGSIITENSSGGAGGGIFKVNTVSNCVISLNTAEGRGGALYSEGRSSKFAYNCTICSNKTTSYSTVWEYTLIGGKIFANYAQHGGGAGSCTLENVEIHNNYANGYGGGLYNCIATNCVLRKNFKVSTGTGANAYGTAFHGCDISGTGIDSGRAVNCVFHDISDSSVIEGNPYIDDATWGGHAFAGIPVCTNCLFVNNRLINYSRAIFCGTTTPSRRGSIVNCTVVSNKFGMTFNYMYNETYPVSVENCVFVWNEGYDTTAWRDIHSWGDVSSNGLRFANCAYGAAAGRFGSGQKSYLFDSTNGPMYKFGADGFPADPKFALKNAAHPFEPKTTSPLLGLGLVEPWMADATDIRGEGYARLREGKVDLGCYQCWLNPAGTLLSIR